MNIRTTSLLLLIIALAGCKDGTVGPERLGSIEGRVLTFETRQPIEGVSVTTSPPTSALVTGAEGRFTIESVPAGNYTISARAPNYEPNTVTVSVRDGETTQATIFLEEDTTDSSSEAALDAEIVNWSTYTEGDSAFVRVEYRASNTGNVAISAYEIYFRILAGDEEFFHEGRGEDLTVDETDVDQFEKYTLSAEADEVVIEDVSFVEGSG